ncbi:hypothetical protein G6O69_35105 [Pseudenhygromyxa sp. WMMC2535]|uniref:hypothetical protein n=1 Tax=Pseudenhygromyxa sp. WMMC2535 TaxID=2712867 RepID=UPI0015539403|nr:hypothetical protein [Pseudenhygromyxa sp. WMMC2535]NVB43105.1 hypothetical protein [Pseudenhygromyxa sp. WMMC2535]
MTTLDHFESAFRSAAKDQFTWQPPGITKIMVVTDLDREPSERYLARLQQFLGHFLAGSGSKTDQAVEWKLLVGSDYALVGELHRMVEDWSPDLLCTYRHLHSSAWTFRYSLGEFIHVLTQATEVPVLLTPHPKNDAIAEHALVDTDVVMAMTDHLQGSDRLVNFAAALTQPEGKLWLAHVEDETAYERIMTAIAKIPQIETDPARELIRDKLLQQPLDYVESCRQAITGHRPELEVKPLVRMGQHLSAYRQLVSDHKVDLLIMNTKDEDQLAMHGMAYPVAVEIRDIPLVLL